MSHIFPWNIEEVTIQYSFHSNIPFQFVFTTSILFLLSCSIDVALMEYFKTVFDDSNVVEAKIALDINNLEKKVATRENYIFKLEVSIGKRLSAILSKTSM